MMTLLELAERCENATEPDTSWLMKDVGAVVYGIGSDAVAMRRFYRMIREGAYLDAAMTLVPEGCSWNLHKHSRWARAGVFVDDGRAPGHYCDAATPALALCAAALRARHEIDLARGVETR